MKATLLLILMGLALTAQSNYDGPQFTAEGQLLAPKNFRQWVYLSSGLGMTYGPAAQADQGNPMFDNVFVNPSSYRAFLDSGHWPDKTIFVLEVRRSISKGSINNGGHYQGEVAAIEAAVKDETRFPQKWAYFDIGQKDSAKPLPATSSCNACHRQNAAVENSFVQFYPALLEVAIHKSTLNPAYVQQQSGAK